MFVYPTYFLHAIFAFIGNVCYNKNIGAFTLWLLSVIASFILFSHKDYAKNTSANSRCFDYASRAI